MAHFRAASWWWTNRCPPPPELVKSGILPEGKQPPLYYALMGCVISTLNGWEAGAKLESNPEFREGATSKSAAIYRHRPHLWTDFIADAKFHAIRVSSAFLLAFSGLFLFGGLRRLSPKYPILAFGLTSAWLALPVVSFSGAIINNDSLAMFLGIFSFWLTVRYASGRLSLQGCAGLGAIAGLAVWAKVSTLFCLIFPALTLLAVSRDSRDRVRRLLIAAAAGLIVASPILLYNTVLYGSPGGYRSDAAMGGAGLSAFLYHIGRSLVRTAESFVGLVGQANVSAPGYATLFFSLFFVFVVIGIVAGKRQPESQYLAGFTVAAAFAFGIQLIAGFVWFAGTVTAMTARLFLNLGGPIMIIALWGLLPFYTNHWSPHRLRHVVQGSVVLMLIALVGFFVAPLAVPYLASQAYGANAPAYAANYYIEQATKAFLLIGALAVGTGLIALWVRKRSGITGRRELRAAFVWAGIFGLILSNQVILWAFVMPTYYQSL